MKRIGATVGTAAIAAVAAFAAMGKAAVDSADQLNKLSQSTGVPVEALSQLKYAAELSNLNIDDLSSALARLSRTASEAAQGSKSQADAFRRIGLSAKDSSGHLKSTDELLLEVAEQFSQYQDGVAKAALAQEIFGKSGAQLIPFLNQGREGIDALRKEADALGLTLSSDTARAAGEFNDNLTRLKGVVQGVVNQFVREMLPALEAFSASSVESAKRTEFLKGAVVVLGAAFKALVTAGVIVISTFQQIGQAVYSLAMVQFNVLRGNFREALEEFKSGSAAIRDNIAGDAETIKKIWSGTSESVGESAAKIQRDQKKILSFGSGADQLAEITVKARKIELSATEQFYEQLNELTKTSEEQTISSYYRQEAALKELYKQGEISAQTYNERVKAALDEALPTLEVAAKRITKEIQDQTNSLTEFQLEAARRTQNIIADALTNGFKDGAKGILKAVAQMIADITAQIVAADLAKKLFGDQLVGGGTSGGWIGALFSAAAGIFAGGGGTGTATAAASAASSFSGPRDHGGRGYPGVAYAIGTGAQPEMFVPDTPGMFYPAGEFGVTVNNHFTIEAPQGTVSRQTQSQIAAAAARGAAAASRRNN